MTIAPSHLETLAIARVVTSAKPLALAALATALRRFAPATETEGAWTERVASCVRGLVGRGVLVDEEGKLGRGEAGELERRVGGKLRGWKPVVDRILPARALGIHGDAIPKGRDAWAAAIVGRALGVWSAGAPPSPAALCDALVWRALGLAGKPKRCPEEVRAYAVYGELPGVPRGPSDRGVRLIAAREVGAPRPELRALLDALVRMWLVEGTLGASSGDAHEHTADARNGNARHRDARSNNARPSDARPSDARPSDARNGDARNGDASGRDASGGFAGDVRAIAREVREGVFGERKVFISSVWSELVRTPTWAALTLDDFKARLLDAHRAGAVELARADLVAAMNPELVASSETRADGASFHFIVREAAP